MNRKIVTEKPTDAEISIKETTNWALALFEGITTVESRSQTLLKHPSLLGAIVNILERDLKIVRERGLKAHVFCIALSGLMKMKRIQQMIQVGGSSRSGKSWICSAVLTLFNAYEMDDSSPAAWKYVGNDMVSKNSEVLYMKELRKSDQEDSPFRLMSAEDGGFIARVAVWDEKEPDPTKRGKLVEYKTPPCALITTTTRIDVDDQTKNRMHIAFTDESINQTKQLFASYEKGIKNNILGSLGLKPNTQVNINVLKLIIEKLRENNSVEVYPLAPGAIKHLFPMIRTTRPRSDWYHVLAIVQIIGFLYQFQRPYILTPQKKKVIFALPQDIYYAMEILKKSIMGMSLAIDSRMFPAMKALLFLYDKTTQIGGELVQGFSRQDLSKFIGMESVDIRQTTYRLELLEREGFVERYPGKNSIWKITVGKEDLERLVNYGNEVTITPLILEEISNDARATIKELQAEIPTLANIPESALKVYPIASWFDDDYVGPLLETEFQNYSINLGEEKISDLELYDLTMKLIAESELIWWGGVTNTTSGRSEVFLDRIAKWCVKMFGKSERIIIPKIIYLIEESSVHELIHGLSERDVGERTIYRLCEQMIGGREKLQHLP